MLDHHTARQTVQPAAFDPTPLPLRGDTMLGVCEALGQDFGFNPNWMRVAFAAPVLWNPWIAFAIYLGLGLVVGLSRLLAPPRREAVAAAAPLHLAAETPPAGEAREDIALAA